MRIKLLVIIAFLYNLSILQAQPADFMVGRYTLVNGSTTIGPAFNDFNIAEGVVDISIGSQPNERVLTVQLLPNNNGSVNQIIIDLSSNEFLFPIVGSNLACGTGSPIITYGPAATGMNSTWSVMAGDQSLTINYTENTLLSCGLSTAQSSFILTEFPTDQTYVPDDNFELALINLGYDTVLDDMVTTANISGLLSLDISMQSISDLTGIEDFITLESLYVSNNFLSGTLDLSSLSNLKILDATSNSLSNFMVNQSTIEYLLLNNNNITRLNYNTYPVLERLFLNNNQLNGIPSISNSIEQLGLENNSITSIDLSSASSLMFIYLSNNQLQSLDLRNGNNSLISAFDATLNTNLTCIEVSDVSFMNANFSAGIDSGQMYVAACSTATQTYVPDSNFEQELITLGLDTVLDNYVTNSNVSNVETLNLSNKAIADFRGLEAFVALDTLRARGNALSNFDFSSVPNTRYIDLGQNPLTVVDLSPATAITYLSLDFIFGIQSIDLSSNINLEELRMQLSAVSTVDFSNNPNLKTFFLAGSNNLTSVNTINNPLLEYYDVFICPQLQNIDISQNPLLEYIRFGGSVTRPGNDYPFTTMDFSNNSNLVTVLNLGSRISSFDITNLADLESLTWQNSEVTSLNINNNILLKSLNLFDNQINNIDLSQNILLETLIINDNQVSLLDLAVQTDLKNLNVADNNLSSLNLDNNIILEFFYAQNNSLTSLDLSNNNLLQQFRLQNNSLTELNLNNGANTLLIPNDPVDPANQNLWSINVINNPNLNCIEVSDINYMNTNFTSNVDSTSSFSLNCTTASIEKEEVEVSFYPNPTSDKIYIQSQSNLINAVSIYDMNARLVKQQSFDNALEQIQLRTESLSQGQYLLVIETADGKVVQNLIKE